MKNLVICTVFILLVAQLTVAADKSLWDRLLDVTIDHIRQHGPDSDTAQFVSMSMARHHAWARRAEFLKLVVPHLETKDPKKVAGAIGVLYRFRHYHPMSYLGDFEKDNAEFLRQADSSVYKHFEHFHALNNREVFHNLALYLGVSRSKEAKRELLRIAKVTSEKEQALICLAWHRDPRDMEELFPFMLEDSPAARSLPYHFRNSYGEASIPYLRRALSESKSSSARLEAAFQLVRLRIPAGFEYMHDRALRDPEPKGKRPRDLQRIRQFAVDHLELPRDVSSKDDIAAHIRKKQKQFCRTQD